MRRLNDDRGAVAVMTALLLVPVLIFAALVVDLGSAYLQQLELHNASDAAALGIAQACAAGACTDADANAIASRLTAANVTDGPSTATTELGTHAVKVTTAAVTSFHFAPIFKIANQAVSALSSASWGSPTGGKAVLPIALSQCSYQARTVGGLEGTTRTRFSNMVGTDACKDPSGKSVPDIGWLLSDNDSNCAVTSRVSGLASADPHAYAACGNDFKAQLNKTVLLPVFDQYDTTGYHVYGYAAFRLTDFSLQGDDSWIEGYYTRFVDLSGTFTGDPLAHNLGAQVVWLSA